MPARSVVILSAARAARVAKDLLLGPSRVAKDLLLGPSRVAKDLLLGPSRVAKDLLLGPSRVAKDLTQGGIRKAGPSRGALARAALGMTGGFFIAGGGKDGSVLNG